MAAADAIVIFGANSVTLKYESMFYFTQNWFLSMYVGFVYVILKYLYCAIPYSEYREKNNMVLLKSYEAVTAMAVVLVAPPVNER